MDPQARNDRGLYDCPDVDFVLGSALEDTSEAISKAKEMLKEAYRGFNGLRQQSYALRLILCQELSSPYAPAPVSHATMKEFLMDVSSQPQDSNSCRKHLQIVQNGMGEKIEAAKVVCQQAAVALQDTRKHVAATNKHKRLYKSMKMQIDRKSVV